MKKNKKHLFNLFTYLFCAFAMALFTIISFSCKTYAFTIDNNGNLVGDNLFNDIRQRAVENVTYSNNNAQITFNVNAANRPFIYFTDSDVLANVTYTISINNTNNLSFYEVNSVRITNGSSYTFTPTTNHFDLGFEFNSNIQFTTTISVMLVQGTESKQWEPYGVWYSEVNYDTLDNQYNDLNNTYQRVLQDNQYGFFNYVGSVLFRYTYFGEIAQVRIHKSNLISQGILLNGGIFNPNAIAESDTITGAVNFSFDLETGAPWEVINFYLMENDNYVVNIQIEDDEENTINITKSHSNDILDNYVTPNEIYSKFLESGVNNLDVIIRISFNFQSFDTSARVVSANNGSYNLGYEDGAQFYKTNYDNALRQITLDNNEINRLKQNLSLLQSSYNDLNQTYQNSLNGNTFANLFFTIAETPFASFKQIWSVDFLGVNLAGFVTGILFIGVLIWVVKKIF